MKTIILGLAGATALAAGSPAAAQYANQNNGYGNQGYGNQGVGVAANFAPRIEQLRLRIQAGVQSGAITRAEAPALREQLRALTQLDRQYSVGGLTAAERQTLQARLRNLRQQVRAADGGNGYANDDGAGYGNNGYGNAGNTGQYDRAYDRNNDGFDDRDTDRDGRWDDDERNRTGGAYPNGNLPNGDYDDEDQYEQPAQRGGIGGLIDNVLGRNTTGTSLRVGQRASSGLYALPSQYRNQYRDSSSAYFRTDGRQIYQIDARSQTVVRVYAMNR